ncbi:MAG: nucleotidyltransferase family protein [Ruminiclostridium sp.]|nr:nucleotidyltransferase family protein [Ruminiclostridium sp.]
MSKNVYKLNLEMLRKKDEDIIRKNRFLYQKLIPIISDVESFKIPYAIIKGEALSIQAYGKKGYRNSKDIDILVPRNYCKQFQDILLNHDFQEAVFDSMGNQRSLTRYEKIMFRSSHQIVPYFKDFSNERLSLDVNVDIFWGEYTGKKMDIVDFLSDTVNTEFYGFTARTLSPLKAFVHMCLNYYKDMHALYYIIKSNPFTEKVFQDIYEFYKRQIDADIDKLLVYTKTHGLNEIIYYILYYTNQIFRDDCLTKNVDKFKTEAAIFELNKYGLNKNEHKEWPISFFDRMNHPNLYSVIKSDLTDMDKQKIEAVISIFKKEVDV